MTFRTNRLYFSTNNDELVDLKKENVNFNSVNMVQDNACNGNFDIGTAELDRLPDERMSIALVKSQISSEINLFDSNSSISSKVSLKLEFNDTSSREAGLDIINLVFSSSTVFVEPTVAFPYYIIPFSYINNVSDIVNILNAICDWRVLTTAAPLLGGQEEETVEEPVVVPLTTLPDIEITYEAPKDFGSFATDVNYVKQNEYGWNFWKDDNTANKCELYLYHSSAPGATPFNYNQLRNIKIKMKNNLIVGTGNLFFNVYTQGTANGWYGERDTYDMTPTLGSTLDTDLVEHVLNLSDTRTDPILAIVFHTNSAAVKKDFDVSKASFEILLPSINSTQQVVINLTPSLPVVNMFNGVPHNTQAFSIFDATYYIFYKDYKYYIYNYATNTTSEGVAFGNGTSVMSQIPTGQTINMGYVDAPNSWIYINVGSNWYKYSYTLSGGVPSFIYIQTISNASWFGGGMPTSGWDGLAPYSNGIDMFLFNGSSYVKTAYGGKKQPFEGLPHDIGCIDIRLDDTLKGWAFKGDKYYEISLTYSGIGGGTALIGRRPSGGTLVNSGTIVLANVAAPVAAPVALAATGTTVIVSKSSSLINHINHSVGNSHKIVSANSVSNLTLILENDSGGEKYSDSNIYYEIEFKTYDSI